MISWMLKVILWLQTAGGRGRGALVWIINGAPRRRLYAVVAAARQGMAFGNGWRAAGSF
jgi:hypothetical protein